MANKIPELSYGEMKTLGFVVLIIIIIVAAFSIMKRLGIIKSSEAKKLDVANETLTNSQLFDPKQWNNVSETRLLSEQDAKDYAKRIYDCFPTWYAWETEVNEIFSIFKELTDNIQVSQIAFYYLSEYESDLAADLSNHLNKSEANTLNTILNAI
jgi:hypothetical protein